MEKRRLMHWVFHAFSNNSWVKVKNPLKKILILLSFLIAANLVLTTYYGLLVNNAEELVENSSLQEILENHSEKKSEFLLTSFRFSSPFIEKEEKNYDLNYTENLSSYEQDILLPPPDFFSNPSWKKRLRFLLA